MLLMIVGCSSVSEPEAIQTVNDEIVVIAEDLTIPWTINKVDDTFYVSERGGAIVRIDSNSGEMERQKVNVSKEIAHIGEGGLLGFMLDPQFEKNNEAFMYYSYESGEEIWNRMVKVKLVNGEWNEITSLLDDIPGGNIHNGGRLAIGPDNKLYATTGDAGIRNLSQNVNRLAGKILRMNLDGSIPNDNPFQNSYVFTYGHRNPQGLAWDSSGNMYSTEHGQSAHDEINKIEAGKNYGWPIIQGDEEAPNMEKPLFHTGNET